MRQQVLLGIAQLDQFLVDTQVQATDQATAIQQGFMALYRANGTHGAALAVRAGLSRDQATAIQQRQQQGLVDAMLRLQHLEHARVGGIDQLDVGFQLI